MILRVNILQMHFRVSRCPHPTQLIKFLEYNCFKTVFLEVTGCCDSRNASTDYRNTRALFDIHRPILLFQLKNKSSTHCKGGYLLPYSGFQFWILSTFRPDSIPLEKYLTKLVSHIWWRHSDL